MDKPHALSGMVYKERDLQTRMIAVSSRKAEPNRFEISAEKTWQKVFTKVYWILGDAPAIADVADYACCCGDQRSDYVAIINSDILLGAAFSSLETEMRRVGAAAATSRRFEFDPEKPFPQKTRSVDLGLDIFIATKPIWWTVASEMPKHFKMGAPQWDTWLHGYFGHNFVKYYDFSKWGCVFHPKHERKPWNQPIFEIPWEAKDLEPPKELPKPI